jgi:hypothetical protein
MTKTTRFLSSACLSLMAASLMAAEKPAAATSVPSAMFAPLAEPGALAVVDLASDSAWTLRLDDGPPRSIKVPGGGWNSDQQTPAIQVMREVKDFVRYERSITVPASAADQAVKLRFGAVAHGCEVFLDGKKVGEHHGPQVAFEMDLTPFVTPGKPQVLQVKAYHRRHYINQGDRTAEVSVGWDYPDGNDEVSKAEAKKWCDWAGNSKVGYGITRSISLVVLPAVHVAEAFVQPSVARQQFSAEVWIQNETSRERSLTIGGSFSSWNRKKWSYPALTPVQIKVAANSTVKATLGPVPWKLGPDSYWWPNIPYREDYLAQLHFLNLQVKEGAALLQSYPQRFGFVEHAEGPYYYMVNGVRVTGISDATAEGQVSFYDAYVSPAWLPPTGPGTGAPESWRRYMRVGINTNRLHCSPPTEYMMQAADEVGFMVIPEAPIWGNSLSRYDPQYTPHTYHDLGRACRNHPSIARYSLANEVREDMNVWRPAIDDMREVDDAHPLVFETCYPPCRINGIKGGHAFLMAHYQSIQEKITHEKGPCGMGEHFWDTNGIGLFAVGARTLRMNDWCYMSGWSWVNYWPNFLQGMNHDLHAWKVNDAPDRMDGIDGWGSPIVQFVQQSFHPYLVQDHLTLKQNPGEPVPLGGGQIQWPYQNSACAAGKSVERLVEVFNGGLTGNRLTLLWSLHWDKPDGPLAMSGVEIPCVIEPGFHATEKIAFTAPALETGRDERNLFLVLESRKEGRTVFRDDTLCITLHSKILPSSAQFLGTDEVTKGNWRGKYGGEGHLIVGRENEMPTFAEFAWKSGGVFIYEKETDDVRALEFFQNDVPTTHHNRIAAAQYGERVVFEINAGTVPRRLSLYQFDWDSKEREQEVLLEDETGRTLDRQTVKTFSGGSYLSWKVQGKLRVSINKASGQNANVSGIFLDLAKR